MPNVYSKRKAVPLEYRTPPPNAVFVDHIQPGEKKKI